MVENKLTRETIVETAVGLLNEVGLDGLTMRRLAAELGVQNPALYWHFRNKQELLDEMADAMVVGAGMGPPGDGESWQDWLMRRSRAYRESVLSYRDGARIVSRARLGPKTVQAFEGELAAMVEQGFPPLLALRTISTLSYYATGFVLQEQTTRQEYTEPPADPLAATAALLGGPDAVLLQAVRAGGSPLSEAAFDHGLRAIIAGTEAVLGAGEP
ncbi:TetR family transcriptional regulator [Flindersiella endophytica]